MEFRDDLLHFVGYILPDKEDDNARNAAEDAEIDDEEAEKQPEFLDLSEMNSVFSGGYIFQSSLPATTEVNFMVCRASASAPEQCRIRGCFALKDPWWQISCIAKKIGSKFRLKGNPSYSLRTDVKEEGRAIVSLFLTACGVHSDSVTEFMKWLPESIHVDPINVQDILNDFGKDKEDNRKVAENIRTVVFKSDAGFHVRAASMYPLVMKYLPTLLPGQFLDLLNKGKEEDEQKKQQDTAISDTAVQDKRKMAILARLEELLKTDVWKLGFNYIMHKELHLVRCEAKLGAFKDCGIFQKLSPQQQKLLLLYEDLKTYCREFGHTYIDREHLEMRMRNKMREESTWETVDFLRRQGVLIVEKQKVALQNLYMYEVGIAQCLNILMKQEPWRIELDVREVLHSMQHHRARDRVEAEADVGLSASVQCGEEHKATPGSKLIPTTSSSTNWSDPVDEDLDPTLVVLDPDQVQAAEMMCSNPVTVISGKGGCGKTAVVSSVFKAAMEQLKKKKENGESEVPSGMSEDPSGENAVEVLLTAPTGRAASLLSKRTSFTAYTMHQVLWNFRNTQKNEIGEPLNWKFANVCVLVVDEGSLVCVQILESILTMLTRHARLQKFIILGDVRQLPSIAPGNVLNDLFSSLMGIKWAIEMRTNHRAESELIVNNAGLIADMGEKKRIADMGEKKRICHLNFDAVVDLSETVTMPSPNKKFILILLPRVRKDDDLQTAIKLLLEGPAPGLEDDRTSQFVAFKRDECALINELCCKHYSQHCIKTHKYKTDFQIGDKVCCTRNGYVTHKDKDNVEEQKEDKERLCNGEIFFITHDLTVQEGGMRGRTRRELTLDSQESAGCRKLTVDFGELNRECKPQHAWARTIHTFQGSEADTVVYVVGDSKRQTWKHVYTAVTRGQKRVYVIAKQRSLEDAIKGKVIKRCTRLAGLVTEMVARHGPARGDGTTQASQAQVQSPKQSSSFGSFLNPEPTTGPSQAFSSMMSQYAKSPVRERAGQSLTSPGSGFAAGIPSQLGSPIAYKRQSNTDNCTTPTKSLKTTATASPLSCTRLGLLSQNGLNQPKQQFPEDPQSCQDQAL
ncbi:DNA helicase B [Electrophorus electricus]|uniref:DNA helicase B n=1 Tax=Electrophorus electricus TaxID=8005 RepID=UPI0015CFED45|nr:DNA helicase B [Electrophorus electricus]